jgi:hypothetical protein
MIFKKKADPCIAEGPAVSAMCMARTVARVNENIAFAFISPVARAVFMTVYYFKPLLGYSEW